MQVIWAKSSLSKKGTFCSHICSFTCITSTQDDKNGRCQCLGTQGAGSPCSVLQVITGFFSTCPVSMLVEFFASMCDVHVAVLLTMKEFPSPDSTEPGFCLLRTQVLGLCANGLIACGGGGCSGLICKRLEVS